MRQHNLSRPEVLALAALCFAAVTALRFSTSSVADGYSLLYALPIALVSLVYGVRGGLAGAALAMLLVIAWGVLDANGLTLAGYLTRGLTFFLLGGLVGHETDQRRHFHDERELLLAKVEAMARTDELTGLLNRRAWDEELRREMERTRRGAGPLTVGLLDLDRFKSFNDEHGHPGGDKLLIAAAQEWRTRMRVVDTLGRYGGEEFALLLPGAGPDNVAPVVERLRAATPMGQTVSVGLAHWDGEETAGALIARADRALYEAKRGGRDRAVVAG
jgi:diguanylate cyclase